MVEWVLLVGLLVFAGAAIAALRRYWRARRQWEAHWSSLVQKLELAAGPSGWLTGRWGGCSYQVRRRGWRVELVRTFERPLKLRRLSAMPAFRERHPFMRVTEYDISLMLEESQVDAARIRASLESMQEVALVLEQTPHPLLVQGALLTRRLRAWARWRSFWPSPSELIKYLALDLLLFNMPAWLALLPASLVRAFGGDGESKLNIYLLSYLVFACIVLGKIGCDGRHCCMVVYGILVLGCFAGPVGMVFALGIPEECELSPLVVILVPNAIWLVTALFSRRKQLVSKTL